MTLFRGPIGGPIRHVQRVWLGLALCTGLSISAAPTAAVDPLDTVRAFCRADGAGARLAPRTWPAVADLVGWDLEPAWDTVRLINGYEVGNPRPHEAGVALDVQYTVTAEVHTRQVLRERHIETRTYVLEPEGHGWRIRAPAPPPFVFESGADPDALQALLDPESSPYVSASALVWQLLRGAGWEVPYIETAALPGSRDFADVRTAQLGDVAIYYDGDQPYHVGIVESDDRVVSSTMNGGIRRTPFAAFPGEVRYRRPVIGAVSTPTPGAEEAAVEIPPVELPDAEPDAPVELAAPPPEPTPTVRTAPRSRPAPPQRRRPTATATPKKRKRSAYR